MTLLSLLELLNYGLVLLFGLFLSTFFAGGWTDRRQKRLVLLLCPLFLSIQAAAALLWGTASVRYWYPFLVHLPLVLILILVLKKAAGVAVVSVLTAYLCCQLPRWISLALTALTGSALLGEVSYTLAIFPLYYLLHRYFTRTAHSAMTYSNRSLLLFGSLPLAYYLFDYAAVVYSDALYRSDPVLAEFLPTALIVFYVLFLTAYHAQVQKQTQGELQRSALEAELEQSGQEMDRLRQSQAQVSIIQHDMRHHLVFLDNLLAAEQLQQAREYIHQVQSQVEAISPRRYCENETVNLLCSSFSDRAKRLEVSLQIETALPKQLFLSDPELGALLSNGLENSLHAVSGLPSQDRWISFYCGIRHNKFLIEIRNPYMGTILLRDGLPVSDRPGHGYGCRSIQTIAARHHGLCTFDGDDGIFTLRIVLPEPTS